MKHVDKPVQTNDLDDLFGSGSVQNKNLRHETAFGQGQSPDGICRRYSICSFEISLKLS